ncbi:MAG: hypothetical protein GTN68_40305 [Candidatus Aminicenantes bacterium]|nr:hypothetical protein [Candidatus Aminicenantes bacterium]
MFNNLSNIISYLQLIGSLTKVIKELAFVLVAERDVIAIITMVGNVVVCTNAPRYVIGSRLMYLL